MKVATVAGCLAACTGPSTKDAEPKSQSTTPEASGVVQTPDDRALLGRPQPEDPTTPKALPSLLEWSPALEWQSRSASSAIALSSDQNLWLLARKDKTLELLGFPDAEPVAHLSYKGRAVRHLAYPASSEMFYTAHKNVIQVWAPGSETPKHRWASVGEDISSLACSPDGRWVVAGKQDGSVHLWHRDRSRRIGQWKAHNRPIIAASIAPDGQRLATADSAGSVHTWGIGDGTQLSSFSVQGSTTSPSNLLNRSAANLGTFSADASTFAFVDHIASTLCVWRVDSEALVSCSSTATTGAVTALAVSANGTAVAWVTDLGAARLWNLATGREFASAESGQALEAASLSADGSTLLTASSDGFHQIWKAPFPTP